MKCSFCGHELEPGSNFCPECGTMMSVDDDCAVDNVSKEQKYEPDSAEVYSKEITEEGVLETEPEEEIGVPEYVPQPQGAFEDYNTIRRNEEEAEAAFTAAAAESEKEAEEEDDPFAELHPDSHPVSFALEKNEEPAEEASSDDDDMYVKPSKGKKGGVTIAVLTLVLVAVIVVGVNAVRNNGGDVISVFKKTTSESQASESTTASTTTSTTASKTSTTKKDEKSTTDKTTKQSTTANNSKESTTEKNNASSTKSTTRASSSAASTTGAATTRAYTTTTRAYTTTTRAYTTTTSAQTTYTKPATTASSKSTGESLQKPSKYYSSPVTRYASENGISMRYAPSSSSSIRASLSVGGEVKVYGEENGYCYVYYSRYGIYGWVSASYLSKERPVADSEVKVSGVVKPDKTYSNVETKTVTTSDGLRLRKGPGTSYDTIRYLGKGYPVAVKGTSTKNPGWVYVTDITRGVSGWVSSEYLK